MPRRANRDEPAIEPLPEKHLLLRPETPLIPGQRQWVPTREWDRLNAIANERRRERTEERRRQRVIEAMTDWDHCLVPGCDTRSVPVVMALSPKDFKDPDRFLPLCFENLTVAWTQVEREKQQSIIHVIYAKLVERRLARQESAEEAAKKARLASTDGHIYFVGQNQLIKVGWTRNLHSRLRAYGAGVEVLAFYKATRDDETHLHRQLTPYRAKGREWYRDSDYMRSLIRDVIDKHGEPVIDLYWTEPKEVVKQRRR